MKEADEFTCPAPAKRKKGGGHPVMRVLLFGAGVPSLLLWASFVATDRAPGLADFLFGLTALWMLFVRLFEASGIIDGAAPPAKAERRRVGVFTAVLTAGAAGLYALAKFVSL
jgi:hypothetical protein